MIKIRSFEELAEDAFAKAERVRLLQLMNTPTDYDDRKKAFVQLAVARHAAAEAEQALLAAQQGPVPEARPNDPWGKKARFLTGY